MYVREEAGIVYAIFLEAKPIVGPCRHLYTGSREREAAERGRLSGGILDYPQQL